MTTRWRCGRGCEHFNTCGRYQHPERVIRLRTTNLLNGLKIALHADRGIVRGCIYVGDNVAGPRRDPHVGQTRPAAI
jgi:dTDP-D-glucose 4,6-dehydratase